MTVFSVWGFFSSKDQNRRSFLPSTLCQKRKLFQGEMQVLPDFVSENYTLQHFFISSFLDSSTIFFWLKNTHTNFLFRFFFYFLTSQHADLAQKFVVVKCLSSKNIFVMSKYNTFFSSSWCLLPQLKTFIYCAKYLFGSHQACKLLHCSG